jgi:hypothetical protein
MFIPFFWNITRRKRSSRLYLISPLTSTAVEMNSFMAALNMRPYLSGKTAVARSQSISAISFGAHKRRGEKTSTGVSQCGHPHLLPAKVDMQADNTEASELSVHLDTEMDSYPTSTSATNATKVNMSTYRAGRTLRC